MTHGAAGDEQRETSEPIDWDRAHPMSAWASVEAFPHLAGVSAQPVPGEPGTEIDDIQPAEVRCLIVSSSESGKSSFIVALRQACLTEPAAHMQVLSLDSAATQEHFGHELRRSDKQRVVLRIHDASPGSDEAPDLPTDGPSSERCLVVLVDPFETSSDWWSRWLPKVSNHGALRFDRAVVLLTKIGSYCELLAQRVEMQPWLTGLRTTPRDLVDWIDPGRQSAELLGPTSLALLRNLAPTEKDLVVGSIDSLGLLDREGRPTPHGIQEALHFVAFGRRRGRLRCLEPSDVSVEDWILAPPVRG